MHSCSNGHKCVGHGQHFTKVPPSCVTAQQVKVLVVDDLKVYDFFGAFTFST